MKEKLVIGITQGDCNGIGYEVIIKSLANANVLDLFTPIVYGSSKAFAYYKKQIPETGNINTNLILYQTIFWFSLASSRKRVQRGQFLHCKGQ